MQNSQLPLKWFKPFASDDSAKVEIPVTTADPTRASQSAGFPPLTMQPPESGGVPPQGEDFNGAMNQVARLVWWAMAGGALPFDAAWAANANIVGYPQGASVAAADLLGNWFSTADNNVNNPDTNGAGWVPGYAYGATSLTGLTNANVTLTPAQAAKGVIRLAGALTGNIQIIFPIWLKDWIIINNCTGAFSVTCKTASGSGVVVSPGGAQIAIGDGTNLSAPVGSGRLLRTLVYTRVAGVQNVSINGAAPTPTGAGTYVPGPGAAYIIGEAQGGGNAGAGGSLPASGNISLGAPGGAGAYGKGLYLMAAVGASQTITVGAAGAPVSGAAGAVGASSSIGTLLSAPGGLGSQVLNNFTASANANGNNSLTAAPTGANLVSIRGGCGALSLVINTGITTGILGGPGGASQFGLGGVGVAANTTGSVASSNWGSGGGGVALTSAAGTAVPGGAATDGAVIIQEFA